ncbi:hypothetical protein B0T16DRAFT_414215 [Cercophora newfieldiana]|uniref:Uncharacterized protein n=1 Tax=Cercophora newfieldiana TaxID=92897 RepID=A0AA39Y6C2_9PEZI|nr:hypothetical protein B0T16DRAFT_414215 [Cercophora newfieldiana]
MTSLRSLRSFGSLRAGRCYADRALSTVATFHYLSPLDEYRTVKPFYINIPDGGIPGAMNTNEISEPYHGIYVRDIRAETSTTFSLDKQGFEVAVAEGTLGEAVLGAVTPDKLAKPEKLLEAYAPAMEAFLKQRLKAERVFTFATRYRCRSPDFPELARGSDPNISQPVQGVHADFTPDYARTTASFVATLRGFQSELALSERRWQLISAWRPLIGPLYDWPLAVLDATSVDSHRDLVASDNVYPHQVSETYNVFYHPDHRWYYLSQHKPHEILLFKSFDSKSTGDTTRVCAHAAFQLLDRPANAPPRRSVECVSLVLFPRGSADKVPQEVSQRYDTPT